KVSYRNQSYCITATEFAYWAPNIESTKDKSMTDSLKRKDDEGGILEDHFDGDRRNDTIEDNANVNHSTNVYLDVNQNTSIPEVVEDLSSLDRSRDKAERLAHHNNGLDDLDISLRNRLLH
nr:hypothetical protein [Tanacetum cinerariifolium]